MSEDTSQELIFVAVPDEIRGQARARPDRVALIHGDRMMTYGELDATMDRVAATLQSRHVSVQDAVAICASSSIEYVAVFCGALRAGVVVAPLAPSSTSESLAMMVSDCDARLLFVDRAMGEHLRPMDSRIACPRVSLDGSEAGQALHAWLAPEGATGEAVSIDPDWAYNIIYSSGTTGAPKGIVQPHAYRSPAAPAGTLVGYGQEAVAVISTGLYSNTTLVSLFPALSGGGTVVLMDRFDARGFLELSVRHRATHAMLVPIQYQRIMAVPDFDRFDLSSFQMKFCTSAPFAPELKRDVLARWPGGLTEYYGMTEGGGGTVLFAHETPEKSHTVGRPWPHIDVRLIDDQGHEVGPDEVGEIVGFHDGMMKGYHNQPGKTEEATWVCPDGRRFIRNGDIGRFDADGFLILMDRKKDVVISGGFNIYPSDLEAALMDHPCVAEAAVIGVPSAEWGETPVAFVTLRPGADADAEDLRRETNARLGKTQRIAGVQILDVLPRSHIGKVLKRTLRDSYTASGPASIGCKPS